MLPLPWLRPWMLWAAAVVALVVLLAMQTVRLADERTSHQTTKTNYANLVASAERKTREAVEAARAEEQRRTTAVQEIANETQAKLDAAIADADAAADAGQRLRERIAQLTAAGASCAASRPGAAGTGKATAATYDLLADVQRRIDEAQNAIARFADRSHAAGTACQQSYDALN